MNEDRWRWLVIALALELAGCASLFPRRGEVPPGPRGLDAASPEERSEYVRRAQVWQPVPTATLDLLAGPQGEGAFAFEQEVSCDYAPEVTPGGGTPKFHCRLASGEVVKVKFGQDNAEVYGEVAGTRLFWALGFGTDRQYPVRVTCRNCPPDPWRQRAAVPDAVHVFDPAIIERGPEGTKIEVRKGHEGWEWWELQTIDERAGGAPRAHVDALRLLAAFVQHSDNKDEQQQLVCLPGATLRDATGQETCARPFLFVVDLGATFSRAAIGNTNKFEFHHWSTVPLWRDAARCIAKLKRAFTGTFANPRISEEGRAFLAERLMQLTERQIRDLFVAVRAEKVGERVTFSDGVERTVTAEDWAQAFLRRRAEIVEHRCPE
jgi:hypothetical protein